jgi:hypothetical protein
MLRRARNVCSMNAGFTGYGKKCLHYTPTTRVRFKTRCRPLGSRHAAKHAMSAA